jgi:orotidine-5'-phosphate decarboxylase
MPMTAQEKLKKQNEKLKFVCLGLDTDIQKIPASIKPLRNPILEFNTRIIQSTSDITAAYKFNLAFYEKEGSKGLEILRDSIRLIPPDILIIGDGKRSDIGNTSEKYAEMLYDEFGFDSATLNPYMGKDSLDPFLAYESKLNFVLALTSNPGASDFEKLKLADNSFLYQEVIRKVKSWCVKNNCGLVFGATKKEELLNDIKLFGDLPILLPGIGAQGGNIEDLITIFKDNNQKNFLINVSRGIIYKSSGEDFAEQARAELNSINDIITRIMLE